MYYVAILLCRAYNKSYKMKIDILSKCHLSIIMASNQSVQQFDVAPWLMKLFNTTLNIAKTSACVTSRCFQWRSTKMLLMNCDIG